MASKQDVIAEALTLPETERMEIVEALYDSLEGPTDLDADQEWAIELEKRVKAIDAGQAQMMSWEQSRKQIAGNGDGEAPT